MTSHTPGPWTYDGSHIYAPDGEIIAQVHNPGRTTSHYPLVANRNLMASAPELLVALKAYDRWNYEIQSARKNGESVYSYTELQDMRDEADELARAAIAKATGATP